MRYVIISVPHGGCREDIPQRRSCDRRASLAADSLERSLIEAGFTVKVIKNRLPRHLQDQNRRPARYDSQFRQAIRDQLREYQRLSSEKVWVFDVHSFPKGVFGSWTDKVVLLDIDQPPSRDSILILSGLLQSSISQNVRLMLGSQVNDIEKEMRGLGARSVLIEFVEEQNFMTPQQLQDATRTIAIAATLK